MKRNLALLSAVLFVTAVASGTAAARDAFAISIGVPGIGVGYSNAGYAVAVPPIVAAPPAVYYGAAYPYYYPVGPVVYGRFAGYYGPYGRYRYWHR